MRFAEFVDLRCRFTGETFQEARQILREGVNGSLLSAWHKGTKISDLEFHLGVTTALRGAAMPEANSVHQRVLEMSLLLAVRECQGMSVGGPYLGHRVFRAVSPRHDGLMVDVVEDVVEPFLRALLPPLERSPSGQGVPGLRLTPGRRHLRLCLLDRDGRETPAQVFVRGVGKRQWERIWQNAKDTAHDDGCIDPVLGRFPGLSRGERDGFLFHRRHCGPVALGSMMLRRIGLLRDTFAIDTWTGNGGAILNVEMDKGPSIHSVLSDLHDPLFGVMHNCLELDVSRAPFGRDMRFARVVDVAPTPSRYTGERDLIDIDPPALALRVLPRFSEAGTASRRADA